MHGATALNQPQRYRAGEETTDVCCDVIGRVEKLGEFLRVTSMSQQENQPFANKLPGRVDACADGLKDEQATVIEDLPDAGFRGGSLD